MSDVNKVIIVGRLGKAPIQRETKNGRPVANFPVATSRHTNGGAEAQDGADSKKEETQWHQVVAWNKVAESCTNHLKKGEKVYVEGSLRMNQYEDKQGQTQRSYEIYADRVVFLGGGGSKEKH